MPEFKLKIVKVSCGDNHIGILSAEGLLYMCGSNLGHKLGIPQIGDKKEIWQPTLVEDLLPSLSKDQNDNQYLNKVVDFVCGNSYSLAITTSGHAFSWGTNSYGALGLGPKVTCASKPTIIEYFVM